MVAEGIVDFFEAVEVEDTTARSLPLRLLASSACWTRSANMLRLGRRVSGSDSVATLSQC